MDKKIRKEMSLSDALVELREWNVAIKGGHWNQDYQDYQDYHSLADAIDIATNTLEYYMETIIENVDNEGLICCDRKMEVKGNHEYGFYYECSICEKQS